MSETALAFAQKAASEVLPLLIGYEPAPAAATAEQQREWRLKWGRTARTDTSAADGAVVVPDIRRDQYQNLQDSDLDDLWTQIERAQTAITLRVEEVASEARRREEELILNGGAGAPEERTRHWLTLKGEYEVALADLQQRVTPKALRRPVELEQRTTRRFGRQSAERRLYNAHRGHLYDHARNEQRRALESLLRDLLGRVHERVTFMSNAAANAHAAYEAGALRQRAEGSAAWRGRLDRSHPFQLHALDLSFLREPGGGNRAVQRLYRWATTGIGAADHDGELDYRGFLGQIAGAADIERLEHSAEELSETVVRYFQPLYLERLDSANLLQLLAEGLTDERRRPGVEQPVERALTELLGQLRALMTDLITFDERMGGETGSETLKREVFLSCHTRDGSGEEDLLKRIATQVGILPSSAEHFRTSLDRHRLQVSHMRHAFSLSTIYDFFSPVNSAMERYGRFQAAWRSSPTAGSPPPHACAELELLVSDLRVVERLLLPVPSAGGHANGRAGSDHREAPTPRGDGPGSRPESPGVRA